MEGFRVDCAPSGGEGLAMARAHAYDGLFLDLRLPDVSGLDVLRQLRREGNCVRVFVLTGFGDVESALAAGRLGAAGYLHKPLMGDDLVAAANELVRPACVPVSLKLGPRVPFESAFPGVVTPRVVTELLNGLEKLAPVEAAAFREGVVDGASTHAIGEARRGEARRGEDTSPRFAGSRHARSGAQHSRVRCLCGGIEAHPRGIIAGWRPCR
jgi:CheY-like chemotaxis protein